MPTIFIKTPVISLEPLKKLRKNMKHYRKITNGFLFLTLALLAGCCSVAPLLEHYKLNKVEIHDQSHNSANIQKDRPDGTAPAEEIFHLKENMIIYFTISKKEFDSYDTKKQNQVTEVLSDFYAYAEGARKVLKKHRLDPVYTVSRRLQFRYSNGKMEEVSIDNTKHIVGIVFVGNKKKPEIYYGIYSAGAICDMASRYFGIKIAY